MWLLGSKPLHFTKQNMASMMLHQQKRNQTLGANEKNKKHGINPEKTQVLSSSNEP
jgi:hypothetical protein